MMGQTAIIVGGASGLGLVTAKLMVKHGVTKIGLVDRNEALLQSSAASLRELGIEVATAAADISRAGTAHRGFE
jgi:3-oxoacyl-[acyl-carrier protein] reductase